MTLTTHTIMLAPIVLTVASLATVALLALGARLASRIGQIPPIDRAIGAVYRTAIDAIGFVRTPLEIVDLTTRIRVRRAILHADRVIASYKSRGSFDF